MVDHQNGYYNDAKYDDMAISAETTSPLFKTLDGADGERSIHDSTRIFY